MNDDREVGKTCGLSAPNGHFNQNQISDSWMSEIYCDTNERFCHDTEGEKVNLNILKCGQFLKINEK